MFFKAQVSLEARKGSQTPWSLLSKRKSENTTQDSHDQSTDLLPGNPVPKAAHGRTRLKFKEGAAAIVTCHCVPGA